MLPITDLENKEEYLRNQSHDQLVIFLMNAEREIKDLENRLFLLSGCKNYGNDDSSCGTCIDCCKENPDLFSRCKAFNIMKTAFFKK